jgi:hypothetical protein
MDRNAWWPPTAGVPQGGMVSPGLSTMGLDGLADVGPGGRWHRRVHQNHAVRWADDGIGSANARAV